jgi:hypothetical protein
MEANPRAARFVPHQVLVPAAAGMLYCFWYSASLHAAPNVLELLAYGVLGLYICLLAPHISFFLLSLATVRRKNVKRAAKSIVVASFVCVLSALFCCLAAYYVVLSDRLRGIVGLAVNGESARAE